MNENNENTIIDDDNEFINIIHDNENTISYKKLLEMHLITLKTNYNLSVSLNNNNELSSSINNLSEILKNKISSNSSFSSSYHPY